MKNTGIFSWIRLPKWSVFWFSMIATVAFVASSVPQLSGLCSRWEPNCQLPHLYFAEAIFWAPVLLLMSIVTYPLNEKVHYAWVKFALPWVVLSTVVVFFKSSQA